jgi:hypothetical protein
MWDWIAGLGDMWDWIAGLGDKWDIFVITTVCIQKKV